MAGLVVDRDNHEDLPLSCKSYPWNIAVSYLQCHQHVHERDVVSFAEDLMVGRKDECVFELDNAGCRSGYAFIQALRILSFEDSPRDRVCLI